MGLPPFRIRTLMIVVAIAAVVVAISVRKTRFRAISRYHQEQAGIAIYYLGTSGRTLRVYHRVEDRRLSPARFKWHRAMAMKYHYAADNPWLPVTSDPPAPR